IGLTLSNLRFLCLLVALCGLFFGLGFLPEAAKGNEVFRIQACLVPAPALGAVPNVPKLFRPPS
ncbi:MAG: hypothetical protein SNG49_05935, partial [Rikenellaceae bacterium]